MTTLMISWQLDKHATFITADRYLHFYRFYDTKMQILTGNYSYFQTNYAFYHSGRIFNALYGPLFAYLNGFLVIICKTWYRYQILIDYLVFLLGGIGMYQLGNKAKVNQFVAILLSLIYLQFGIIVGILRANNFMSWGAALAPFVMMQALNMMQDSPRPIHWLALALIMSLLVQIHLLSTVILAATLLPFAIYGLIKTNAKGKMIIDTVKAVGLTLLLTANIWSVFLFLKKDNVISLPKAFDLEQSVVHISHHISSHGYLMPLMGFLLAFQLLYILFNFKRNAFASLATVISLLIIFIASKYFPWASVQQALPVLKQAFQFPYRLTVGAWPLFLVSVGMAVTDLSKRHPETLQKYLLLGLVFIMLQNFGANINNNRLYSLRYTNPHHVITMGNAYKITPNRLKIAEAVSWGNSNELFKLASRSEADYLPLTGRPLPTLAKINHLYRHGIIDQQKNYHYSVRGSKLILSWRSRKSQQRRLPVVMYHESILHLNGRKITQAPKNEISMPLVSAKKGINHATLQFHAPLYFWVLLILTLVSWLSLVVYGAFALFSKGNNKK